MEQDEKVFLYVYVGLYQLSCDTCDYSVCTGFFLTLLVCFCPWAVAYSESCEVLLSGESGGDCGGGGGGVSCTVETMT